MKEIYLDYNASAPLRPAALQAMQPWFGAAGNPSSTHLSGQQARNAIEDARAFIAGALRVDPGEIVFTSGGTESDNLAVQGAVAGRQGPVLAAEIEHPAVLGAVELLKAQGRDWKVLRVDPSGRVDMDAFKQSLSGACLATLMWANNETGVLQDIPAAAALCSEAAVPLMCDAVQALGKVDVDLSKIRVNYLSASAHKFGGPTGIGFLYVRKGSPLAASLRGGEQEFNLRPGTENTAGIVGMAAALGDSLSSLEAEQQRQANLRDQLQGSLAEAVPGLVVHGQSAPRVANTLSVSFPGVESDVMIMKLDQEGIRVSAGSACAAGAVKPSRVLKAMGVDDSRAKGVVRFSLGPESTKEAVDRAAGAVVRSWREIHKGGQG